jgi:hypothetical protein
MRKVYQVYILRTIAFMPASSVTHPPRSPRSSPLIVKLDVIRREQSLFAVWSDTEPPVRVRVFLDSLAPCRNQKMKLTYKPGYLLSFGEAEFVVFSRFVVV